MAQKFQENIIR